MLLVIAFRDSQGSVIVYFYLYMVHSFMLRCLSQSSVDEYYAEMVK